MFKSNRERILFFVLAIIGVVLTLNIGSAFALNTDACNDEFWHDPNVVGACIGKLELDDMGSFDSNNAWVWDPAFEAEFGAWGVHPEDWQTRHAPTRGIAIQWSSLDIKRYASQDDYTRVMGGLVNSERVPRIWRVEGPAGEQTGYFVGDYLAPEGCFEGWEPECQDLWIDLQFDDNGAPLNREDVISIRWVERDALADIGRVPELYKSVPYQQFPRNFWNFDRDYRSDVTWYNNFAPEVGFPADNELVTIEYTFANGEVHTHEYRVPDTRVMPQVTIETVNKEDVARTTFKGKVMKDGLKIRWNDPPFREIMRPGIELKVFVGNYLPRNSTTGTDIFHWIDSVNLVIHLLYLIKYRHFFFFF